MACVNKILIMFGLVALIGCLIPSEVAATARDIATKSSPEAVTNATITMVVDDYLNYLNLIDVRGHMSLSFDVNNDDYSEFIQKIRDTLNHSYAHGIPVLAPQRPETPENAQWLDIRLVAGSGNIITVRLEQSNLYVRGYQRTSSTNDSYWEFTDTQLIPDSLDLRFSGSYTGLERTAGGVGRDELPLGAGPLDNAVRTLAGLQSPYGGDNPRLAARSMLIIVQMISEAARFRTISEHIGSNYWNNQGAILDTRMVSMQNGWGQLSTAVRLMMEIDPTNHTPLPNIPSHNPTGVYTYGQALAALGLLLITRPERGLRSTPDYGRCLMNLEYVRVNNIVDEEHRANNVFGTVRVDDGWYTYDYIRRERHESERLPPGAFATLTGYGHSFPVSGMDAFTVNVTLFEGSRGTSDDNIAEGYILWDRFVESVTFANYDKHLQRVVKGDYGDVTIGYSVLSYALGVTVQVVLIDSDKEFTSEIYGTLTASQDLPGSTALAPISLFDKSSGDRVELRRYESFPLTRMVFAASTATQLTISADLWDHDYLSLDDNIALGSASFTVRPGKQNISIKGRYGEVEVIVTCA